MFAVELGNKVTKLEQSSVESKRTQISENIELRMQETQSRKPMDDCSSRPHISISISIYFVQYQVGLQSQSTNEQETMLSQLPAVTDRKVKQQYN